MKKFQFTIPLAFMLFFATSAVAEAPDVIRKVDNVVMKDLHGKPAKIPHWGEKNLMLFYIDPDRAGQNQDFTDELERVKRVNSKNIVGMGIMNLKDAPFIPNALARKMAQKRTEKNKAIVLSDEGRILSEAWELGDCNNLFVLMFINREGEMVFLRKGEFSQQDKDDFFEVLDFLKNAPAKEK